MQTTDWLVLPEPKIQWPALPPQTGPPREQQDKAKPQCKLPRSQQGSGTCSREKENTSTLVACLSPYQTLEHSCQGKLSPAWKGTSAAEPAGSSLLGMPGCVQLAVVTRGGWRGGDTTLSLLPPLATAGWAQGSRTRKGFVLALCAGTQPLPQLPQGPAGEGRWQHLPRGWRLPGHCTAALCSFCCSWKPGPKNFLAQRGNGGNHGFTYSWFYLLRGKVCSVWDPMVLMGHGPFLSAPLPPVHGRLQQIMSARDWSCYCGPPLLALSTYIPGKLVGTAVATTMACWWQGLEAGI